ncbi:centromere protein W isoform 2-T2 [Morphnus guianensis]
MKRAAPRSTLRRIIKTHKPQLRLATNADLLVRKEKGGRRALRPGVGCGPAPHARLSAPAASSLPSAGAFELLTVSPSASRRSQDKCC